MEQQLLDDHMRLPPPVHGSGNPNSNPNPSPKPIPNPSSLTTASPAADSTTTALIHKSSSQQNQPAPSQAQTQTQTQTQAQAQAQALPRSLSTTLSPPYTNSHATSFYGSGSGSSHLPRTSIPSSSSLSPRPLGPVPAYSPPSYAFSQQQNHDPATLVFPEPPSTELAPLQLNAHEHNNHNNNGSLPSLAYLTGASATSARRFGPSSSSWASSDSSYSPPPPTRPRAWPTGNPYSAYYLVGHGSSADSPARMDIDSMSNGTRGPLSPDHMNARASSVSLDDPDVRMAAEALGDLKADFVSSPRNRTTPLPTTSPPHHFGTPRPPEAEPLLSLVMTSGSLLAKPIEGTVSAYNTTKNFSPGFIKAPVEYVEGVVGSGLHMSGIEGGVRWFFRGKGRLPSSSDLEAGENSNSHKRRKVDNNSSSSSSSSRGGSTSAPRRGGDGVSSLTSASGPEVIDHYNFTSIDKDRRLSMSTIDTLPAYDDARSPAYTENAMAGPGVEKSALMGPDDSENTPTASRPSSTTPSAWQSRLIMSTSGLSIAMSEESLRSLKYCLSWLRWANEHIGRVISALKDALEKYDSQYPSGRANSEDQAMEGASSPADSEQARRELGARISALRSDVLKTLQGVIETVSKYAGGALPDNARALVRRHLTSLPQRFRMATQETVTTKDTKDTNSGGSDNPSPSSAAAGGSIAATTPEEGREKEVHEGAQRVLVLAKEGLDMMAQVSGVLDGTILSAEEWCERLGRKRRGERDDDTAPRGGEDHMADQQQQQQQQQGSRTVPFSGVGVDGDVRMG